MSTDGTFEKAADAAFANLVQPTYKGRGDQYGDTWQLLEGLYDEHQRLSDAWSLIRIKIMRALYSEGGHKDTIVDLVAYCLFYLAICEEYHENSLGSW